jgi:hypothetical protein
MNIKILEKQTFENFGFFLEETVFLSLGQFVVTMSHASTIDSTCTKIFSPQTASRGNFSNNVKILTQNIHPEVSHD